MDTKNKITLQNQDEMCSGKYTFGNEGVGRSAIDYIIVNNRMYLYKKMDIDEEKKKN